MEKKPDFLKEFIQENSKEESAKLKEDVRTNNLEFIEKRKAKKEELSSLETTIETNENAFDEAQKHSERLRNELEELSSQSMLKKISSYLKIRTLQEELSEIDDITEDKERSLESNTKKQKSLSKEIDLKETPYELQKAKEMVETFYAEQKRKWMQSDYTPEDIQKNFSEEHLSSLSLKDYTLLLKRFPKHMVTHVTRQGVRDHIGHRSHTRGEGDYMDNFCKIIEDGKMRSPLGVHLVEEEKEKAIAKFLRLDTYDTKEEALRTFENKVNPKKQREQLSYADNSSIHFATDFVADEFYGSERGNEIFFTYPSAFIASQHHFSGQLNDGSVSTNWNDQWVWADNEEKGISIDAGVVFVPKNTPVDPENGSRYQLDENSKPLKNSSYINKIKKLVDDEEFKQIAPEIQDAICDLRGNEDDDDYKQKNEKPLAKIEKIKEILLDKFNISEEKLLQSLFNYHHLRSLQTRIEMIEEFENNPELANRLELEKEGLVDSIEEMLKTNGNLYIQAEDTIPAEEYWEKYFEKIPEKKPSKIVYYEENDPTNALFAWQERNGISEKSDRHDLGIEGSNVERDSIQATKGMESFKAIALKVIEQYFEKEDPDNTKTEAVNEDTGTKVEKREIIKQSLDELVAEIAQIQNEKYGPILNSDASINMDSFTDTPDYNPIEDGIEIEKLERDWSDADTTNPNRIAYFKDLGLETPEERLQDWRDKKESSETEKMEKAILCIFHKFLHSEFLITRASTHDDYFNGIDTVIVDAKTHKVVGAFDEVRGEDSYQRNQDKLAKVSKKAANGGAHLKYGLNFKDSQENQGQEIIRGEIHHIPLFMVSLTKNDLAELTANMNGTAESTPSEKEIEIFNQLLDSFERQIEMLENQDKKIKGYVKTNIESFKETLGRMRKLGNSIKIQEK